MMRLPKTKKKLIRTLKTIADKNQVVFFVSNSETMGGAWANYNKMFLSYKLLKTHNKHQTISAFFHELAHIVAFRNNKFLEYHTARMKHTYNQKMKILKTAYRAERYVDKLGKNLMKKEFPKYKYTAQYSYSKKKHKKWLKQYWREAFNL
jgi:predicted SprT family Zn-dependent metalloprotease